MALHKLVPPRVQGAVLSAIWNRWTTKARFQQRSDGQCLLCDSDIAEGNIDGFMSYAQASITTLKHQHNIAVAAGKKITKWPCLTVTFPTEGQMHITGT